MGSHTSLVLLAALTLVPDAPAECVKAVKEFSVALEKVQGALPPYEQCITASDGRNQCAEAFDDLDGAQREFEDAVEKIRRTCPVAPGQPP